MINGALITDRQQYFKQKGIDRQKYVVAYKSCASVTTEALVWTYRTTNCDVTSIITTTVPFKDALMKDIKMENTEPKRSVDGFSYMDIKVFILVHINANFTV